MSVRDRAAEHIESAKAAGLHYVTDDEPGISRIRHGGGFVYRDPKGHVVRNPRVLDRIRSIVIPPAWTAVWICTRDDGHLQATGRDARGRKQYRYHPRWRGERDNTKYGRMIDFGLALPSIRRRVNADLKKTPLSRDFVRATVVKLLEKTLIRIGNQEYARANKSFGLTTLLDQHAEIKGSSVRFRFRAKSGVVQDVEFDDSTLARIVKQCREVPGKMLFQYIDERGRPQCIGSADVNAYLQEITGKTFTAKNFRTWAGTVLAATALCECEIPKTDRAFKRTLVPVIDGVAAKLGNTRAVCRSCYIHPAVFDAFRSGQTIDAMKAAGPRKPNFSSQEAAVLALLTRYARKSHRDAAKAA